MDPSTDPGYKLADKAVITFRDVSVQFDVISAVKTFTHTVEEREFVTLVGPSGCGKSTVLRLASGLLQPSSGSIERATNNIGYVFQDSTLMPWRTVRKNVELLGELEKMDSTERARRAEKVLALVGLTEFQDHYPVALSGGMKMRASLARSLLLEPDLFLFDEPFGALDQITRSRLNEELMALYADRRFASIFVTHSVDEAVLLSTRVLVMSARPGTIVAEFDIPFDYPRDLSIRYEPGFTKIAASVAEALGEVS